MENKNSYNDFSFGDIITFVGDGTAEKFKNKDFYFIQNDGEDYILWDTVVKKITVIRSYYFNNVVKIKEEEKKNKITTWALSHEI